jgi:hypothetical protein
MAAIRADYEFVKAFYTPTAPRPGLGILRRLARRCSGRHFFHSRCVDRNGTRTRSTSNRKLGRQAEKEEYVRMDTSSGVPVDGTSLRFRSAYVSSFFADKSCAILARTNWPMGIALPQV